MNVRGIEYEYPKGNMNAENEDFSEAESPEDEEGFSELIRYTRQDYLLGLLEGFFGLSGPAAKPFGAIICSHACR